MIKREVLFREEFETKLKKGVDTLADAVKTTMGPRGRLVLIQRHNSHPTITKDGVTVANAVNLSDETENLGVDVIREAASRTADEAGDGTTTATVLAQSIFNEGLRMKAAGFETDHIIDGINHASSCIIDYLSKKRKEIKSDDDLKNVAMISANGEEEIADLIVRAIKASGADGSIIVEEAKGFKSHLNIVDGFRLDRGFLSPYFVTDKNKMTVDYNNCLVLIADRSFNAIKDLVKPLELSLEVSKPLLIIANELEGDALQGIVLNKTKGILRICAIKSPGFGSARHEMLIDLQAVLGGTVIDDTFDMQSFEQEDFGHIKRAIIHKNTTMLVSGNSKKQNEDIQVRINSIKERLKDPSVDENEKDLLGYRLQQLSGGISILRIGAATESELIERYDRVDDALNATKAAIQEGILPGGGVALVRSIKALKKATSSKNSPSFNAGVNIMKKSVKEPFKQIIRNGSMSPDTILESVLSSSDNVGYDARNNKMTDMFESGILDPHKVVRCAIENSVSSATMLLSVGCCMIDVEKQHSQEDN